MAKPLVASAGTRRHCRNVESGMRPSCLLHLPTLALGALLVAQAAMANGADLTTRQGRPGERIEVSGHDWLTCCPQNTPVEHVELFLLAGTERLRLFDMPANREGAIQAAFEVPALPAGTYRLEVCSRGPELPGVSPGATCLPVEGNFTVLAGHASDVGGSPLIVPLAIGSGVLVAVAVVSALLYRRRRISSAHSDPSSHSVRRS